MSSSLFDVAVMHHAWATERIIDACVELTPEQLRTPAPGTYGPIIDTLRHMVGADAWYLSFFREGVPQIADDAELSLAELREVITADGALWLDVLASGPDPDGDVVEQGDGWAYHATVGVRLAQVVHHGTDHRSQICTALTSLGLTPPLIDVWDFGQAVGRVKEVTY